MRIERMRGDACVVVEFHQETSEKPDAGQLVSESGQRGCPYCGRANDEVTRKSVPDFRLEGKGNLNEVVLLPYLEPSMFGGALTVFCSQHFVGMSRFTRGIPAVALVASQSQILQAS